MERLRHVARATGMPQSTLVREAADALAMAGDSPAGLVTACRRVLAQQPAAASLVYLCARMLCADRPTTEAWSVLDDIASDQTAVELAHAFPDSARVCVLGAPDVIGRALGRRGDIEALVVDVYDEGAALSRRLRRDDAYDTEFPDPDNGGTAVDVPVTGLGAAAAEANILLVEAMAIGPTAFLAASGAQAAAAVARHHGRDVWLVGGVGRVLPGRMWDGLLARFDSDDGFAAREEVVPLDLVTAIASSGGLQSVHDALAQTDCPIVPELY